mgnify:CR=1 FL=1
MRKYMIDYQINGQNWSVIIQANSWSDASNRLAAIKRNGHIAGEVAVSIPVPGVTERIMSWFKKREAR